MAATIEVRGRSAVQICCSNKGVACAKSGVLELLYSFIVWPEDKVLPCSCSWGEIAALYGSWEGEEASAAGSGISQTPPSSRGSRETKDSTSGLSVGPQEISSKVPNVEASYLTSPPSAFSSMTAWCRGEGNKSVSVAGS